MNKPMMRFSGFDDEWEEKKLGDAVDLLTSSLRAKDLEIDGEYPVYDANDLIGYHSTCLSDREYISIIKDGAGVGRMRSLNGHTNITSTMNGLLPNKNFDSNYVVQSLDMIEFDKYVIGTTIPHIYYKDYKSEVLLVPTLPEQKLIGNFFKTIDDLISVQEETVEVYELYKEAMLQKMFPKKGKNLPEVRFDGFDDEWEEKKLKDILTKGSKVRVDDPNNYQRLTVHLNNGGLSEYVPNRKLSDSRPFYQRYAGEIIIGKQNYFNESIAVVPDKYDGFVCSNAIMSFNVGEKCDNLYVYTRISQTDYIKKHEHLSNGTGQKELSERDFLNFTLLIPTLPEQELIGNFFKNLDDTIESHKEKLDIYQQMKEALLQKMFV